uniref:Uncharacterized protein n=2 Tax=Brassica oleracea TaxID=3712 RepID=A0A0D3B0J2_BRAOL
MSWPWVTGFTDWRLIVGLRVREESFTEEKSRFRKLHSSHKLAGFGFRSDVCDR